MVGLLCMSPYRDVSGRQLGVAKCSRIPQVGLRDSDLGVMRELFQVVVRKRSKVGQCGK